MSWTAAEELLLLCRGRTRHIPDHENCLLVELRAAIDCCPDRKAQKRLNAIHLLLCGGSFQLKLAHSGVTERCRQLWISQRKDFADELLNLLSDPCVNTFCGDEADIEDDPRPANVE